MAVDALGGLDGGPDAGRHGDAVGCEAGLDAHLGGHLDDDVVDVLGLALGVGLDAGLVCEADDAGGVGALDHVGVLDLLEAHQQRAGNGRLEVAVAADGQLGNRDVVRDGLEVGDCQRPLDAGLGLGALGPCRGLVIEGRLLEIMLGLVRAGLRQRRDDAGGEPDGAGEVGVVLLGDGKGRGGVARVDGDLPTGLDAGEGVDGAEDALDEGLCLRGGLGGHGHCLVLVCDALGLGHEHVAALGEAALDGLGLADALVRGLAGHQLGDAALVGHDLVLQLDNLHVVLLS